ncbi:tetratricopeptide repeat protein [Babesia caballi]|uniref:Tetratricopeptide repeat protein n=1 Tax=Babesia caballi TaxID=5871 RepID=A0AAV4LYK5_BABCB|nr:tetratricopeptide repeat protein [Babesia caballi]
MTQRHRGVREKHEALHVAPGVPRQPVVHGHGVEGPAVDLVVDVAEHLDQEKGQTHEGLQAVLFPPRLVLLHSHVPRRRGQRKTLTDLEGLHQVPQDGVDVGRAPDLLAAERAKLAGKTEVTNAVTAEGVPAGYRHREVEVLEANGANEVLQDRVRQGLIHNYLTLHVAAVARQVNRPVAQPSELQAVHGLNLAVHIDADAQQVGHGLVSTPSRAKHRVKNRRVDQRVHVRRNGNLAQVAVVIRAGVRVEQVNPSAKVVVHIQVVYAGGVVRVGVRHRLLPVARVGAAHGHLRKAVRRGVAEVVVERVDGPRVRDAPAAVPGGPLRRTRRPVRADRTLLNAHRSASFND